MRRVRVLCVSCALAAISTGAFAQGNPQLPASKPAQGKPAQGKPGAPQLPAPSATPSASAAPTVSAAPADPPAADPATDSYKQHMKVGIGFYEQGNYPAAIAEFGEAYKAKPKASPLVNMALCYKAQFAYPKAIKALEAALAKHSDTMDENDKKAAQTEIDEMRVRLSYVTFKVTPPQFAVTIDDESYPEAAQGKAIPLSPGPHTVKVAAEGYAGVDEQVTLASGQRNLEYKLKANMGFVHIKAAGPKYSIAVDQTALAYGEWSGLLGPGPHVVEMYIPGSPTAPYRVRLDVEVGKSYDVSPGKGGVPISGTGNVTPPPIPPTPKPPAKPVTGPFVQASISLFAPTEQPAAFTGQTYTPGVSAGVRGGYRVNTPVSFYGMFEYSNILVKKKLDEAINYTLQEVRAGVVMRLQTPGKVARFYGDFGGGFVYEWLDFKYPDGKLSSCLSASSPPRPASCTSVNGPDGFFLIEAGLQFSFGNVIVDAALGTHLQSTRGFGAGTFGDWLPMFEGGLRVGYAAW